MKTDAGFPFQHSVSLRTVCIGHLIDTHQERNCFLVLSAADESPGSLPHMDGQRIGDFGAACGYLRSMASGAVASDALQMHLQRHHSRPRRGIVICFVVGISYVWFATFAFRVSYFRALGSDAAASCAWRFGRLLLCVGTCHLSSEKVKF